MNVRMNLKHYNLFKCCHINSTHYKNFGGKSKRVYPLPLFRDMHFMILESAGKIRLLMVEIMTIHLKTINNLSLSLSLSSSFILLT